MHYLSSSDASDTLQGIAFVDAGLSDAGTLINGLENTQVVLLNPQQNGIDQITSVLAQHSSLDSVQIFSHGYEGALQLGSTVVSSANLEDYRDRLGQWTSALSLDADLLFYGCNVAAGDQGYAFINRISELTSADVAASNDLTGIGGDWQLEVSTGRIESDNALSQTAQVAYAGTLELLRNGDFELGLSNWGTYAGTESISTTESFTGTQSLRLSSAASGVNQLLDAVAGESYAFTGSAKSSSRGYTGIGINFLSATFEVLGGSNQQVTNRQWDSYQLDGVAPAGARYVQIWAYKDTANGTFFIDSLGVDSDAVIVPPEPPAAGEELLQDTGFENGLGRWGGFTGSERVSSAASFSGGRSLQMSAAASGVSQFVDAFAGEDYLVSLYAKSSSNDYAGYGINFFDINYNLLSGDVSQKIAATDWQAYQRTATAPADTKFAQVWLYKSSAAGDVFVDEASFSIVEETREPEPGFIGLQTSDITVDEAAGRATVTVQRSRGSDGVITVDYRTIDVSGQSAIAGVDYTSRRGRLTFADGQTEQSVEVPILDDAIAESSEIFGFTIDNVQGGATLLAPRTAQVTITDNDSFTYRGNQYVLTAGASTWAAAQAEAESLGGNLVTINSAGEEAWLKENFGETEDFWMGLNDVATEGAFVWASGEAVTYTNWAPGEPNNDGDQDYGRMNYSPAQQWDDHYSNAVLRGIVEVGGFNGPTGDPDPTDNPTPIAEVVINNLNQPTAIDWRPESSQMFVAQKGGSIKIYEDGVLLETPFIDISDQVNGVRDRGLLDIALHPDFASNPYVYLLFTYDPPEVFDNTGGAGPDGVNNRAARLIRVTADADNGYRTAVAGSDVVLLGTNSTWDNFNGFVNSTFDPTEPEAGRLPDGTYLQDFLNADSESHTIGAVEFGPDGALYVSNGDGASYNRVDPRAARVQDIDSLSGKVLRIDPITGAGLADNPFYNGDASANRSKVYQLGLRNPFRMTINPTSGQLYIGDVGWTQWEEVNSAGPGANFGWPYYEGGDGVSTPTGGYRSLPEAQAFYDSNAVVTPSLLGLNHVATGIDAIVMGDLYTGSLYDAQYQGDLFFNDLSQGVVRNISFDLAGNIANVETFTTGATSVVQMVQGPDELLYYVNLVDSTVGRWVFA